MVYAHQHAINTIVVKTHILKNVSQQTLTENCSLCDVMHHNAMVTNSQVYFNPLKVIAHVYKSFEYSFTSIQLILSGGRAPPIQL
ncbi:MAG: hypothetical protein JWP45_3573 [Mucilaginibacter sp.]|nr:hypothetical protein [Mucilaginibacter sp.]